MRIITIIWLCLVLVGCSTKDDVLEVSESIDHTDTLVSPTTSPRSPLGISNNNFGITMDSPLIESENTDLINLSDLSREDEQYIHQVLLGLREISSELGYYLRLVVSGKSADDQLNVLISGIDKTSNLEYSDSIKPLALLVNSSLVSVQDAVNGYNNAIVTRRYTVGVHSNLTNAIESLENLVSIFEEYRE